MTDSSNALEDRVARLEAEVQEIKHTHAARVDAFAAAQHQMHEALLKFQGQALEMFERMAAQFERVNARLDGHDEQFRDVNRSLLAILDRLPPTSTD